MPEMYKGVAAEADWTTMTSIFVDGEPVQFGDANSGLWGVFKRALDRTAWLKLHCGVLDADNTWKGTQVFDGSNDPGNESVTFGSGLNLVSLNCDVHLNGDMTMESGGSIVGQSGSILRMLSGSTTTWDAGAVVNDHADRTYTGTTTFQGPIVRSGVDAISNARVQLPADAATINVDVTNDIWHLSDAPSGARDVRLQTPSDTTKSWTVTVVRGAGSAHTITVHDDDSGDTLCKFLPDAYTVVGTSGGPSFPPTVSFQDLFAWADFHWSPLAGKWRLARGGGAAFSSF